MRAREQIALQAQLLDEVDAAVTFSDAAGVVRYWNQGAERLSGYSAKEAVGHEIVDLMVPEESRAELLRLRRAALAGGSADGELDVHDKQGRVFPVYVRVRGVALDGPGDARHGVISVAVEISARREAEQAIRRHAERQEEIAKFGRLALKGEALEELFDHAVRTASRVLSADCAWLVEHLPSAPGCVIRAAVGWPDELKGESIEGEARSISGYALRSRGPLVVADWEDETRVARSGSLAARGVRSSVAVLVGDPGSAFGVLAVHYTRPDAVQPDCLPFLDALANVLAETIQARDAQEAIRHQALHDELTGLPNRTLFLDRVAHALERSDRHPQQLAVFGIDVDHFKLVNDTLGHEAGDELLRLIATRLASAIRRSDTLARVGRDEFAVLCEDLPSEVVATRIAKQLMAAFEEPVVLDSDDQIVSASIGIALSNGESSAAELLRDADAALRHAKTAGRARFELFDTKMRARVLGRVQTESALRAALANEDEIYVDYQPLVSLSNGQIVGAEALARWCHPDWGPVSPLEFVAVAEDSGLVHELGAHVLRRAARESAAWQDDPHFAGIAVNVSIRQLVQPDEVPTLVRDVIAAEGITPGFLALEVTETLLIEQLESARPALASLKELGVHLSLDDFGTGYSSLSYLHDLDFDSVKIDRSLIRNIVDTPRSAALAAAIIHMGHSLALQVIAEGIETQEQADRLQALGCDIAQGFYFAPPRAPEQLTALLHDPPNWLSPANLQTASAAGQRPPRTTRQQPRRSLRIGRPKR
jgi:diguanylate cyclase (GGDEF)-like protein/PAS domain S-box-containing protein